MSAASCSRHNDYRHGLPERPPRIAALPVDEKGYPVPFFVAWTDGKPDHRVVDPEKIAKAIRYNKCWICGGKLGKHRAFAVGPVGTINWMAPEPPAHVECARYSAQTCPFLTLPNAKRREANLPESATVQAGVMIRRNPGVVAIWHTREYRIVPDGNGVLFMTGFPDGIEWYAEGRAATRHEVVKSIESGCPALLEMAEKEGPKAVELFERRKRFVLEYLLPPEDAGYE